MASSAKRRMAFRNWYAGDCASLARSYVEKITSSPPNPMAIVAPHAGWRYSGRVAARSISTLRSAEPELVIGFSAIHRTWLERPAIWTEGAWETPLGDLEIDAPLTRELLDELGDRVDDNSRVHDDEHALEVLAPLIRHFAPNAKLVAIMVPPDEDAAALGEAIAKIVEAKTTNAVALASTDLTHYGPSFGFTPAGVGRTAHEWMRENDRRVLHLVETLDAEAIVPEASNHQNSCGSGALAATVAFARTLGARRGTILEHTDSHRVTTGDTSALESASDKFETAVGYAAMTLA